VLKKIFNNNETTEKINTKLGQSDSWFTSIYGLKTFSFDFFIKWNDNFSNGVVQKDIFIKKTAFDKESENYLSTLNDKDIFYFQELSEMNDYLLPLGFNVHQFSFKEREPLSTISILDTTINNNSVKHQVLSKEKIQNLILTLTGKSFHIGSKGLHYYTTQLEKDLSLTNTPYPGDCDAILFDEKTKQPICIIEYQKNNNISTDKEIEELTIDMLTNQKLKIIRLELLAKKLSIPFLVLHYGTNDNLTTVKVEDVFARKYDVFSINNKLFNNIVSMVHTLPTPPITFKP
jgi:hypothetical protein